MNKKILSGVAVVIVWGMACSHGDLAFKRPLPYPEKQRRVRSTDDVPLVFNQDVQRWIDYFTHENRARFALYLSRSGRYEDFMRALLKEEGMPQDLIYLALIESGFSNHAYSRARAVGPWQFIRSTARIYGLKVDSFVDERKDPEKATRAAAHYLQKLHNDFGDWYLAMAAYNAGEGRIQRAIHRTRSHDFWRIASTHHIRPETKNYIPKFIAAAMIAKNPGRFGFQRIAYQDPLAFDTVLIDGPIDLEVAAELAAADLSELKNLNPELILGMTPHGAYALRIPVGREEVFRMAYAELPADQRVRYTYHTVRRGESVWKIARRYGVSNENLMAANNLSPRRARYLKPGVRLVIPKKFAAKVSSTILLAYNQPKATSNKKVNGVEYLIRKDFGKNSAETVTTEEEAAPEEKPVLDQAGIKQTSLPKVEETDLPRPESEPAVIALPPKPIETKTYTIQKGDTLWAIAQTHGVSVSELKSWNKLTNARRIHPGKSLFVSAP